MTRLEVLEKYVVTDSGMNTEDAQWALAMLREAEQVAESVTHEDVCPNCCQHWPPNTPCLGCESVVKAKAFLSKLREEA